MPLAVGKTVDRQHTVIGAAAAMGGFRGICKLSDFFQRKHLCFLTAVTVFRYQRGTEGTHNTGNIGACNFHTGDPFKGPQYRLVIEGSALDHDMLAQLRWVCQLDDLIQRVLDNGIRKACGDIGNGCTFFLRLFHIGVHKHGTAGAQIHRIGSKQSLPGKVFRTVTQGVCEVLNKRATAGGTGFIQKHRIHTAITQLDALHILPADVQYTVHILVKKCGGGTVGNGFHLTLIQRKGGFE